MEDFVELTEKILDVLEREGTIIGISTLAEKVGRGYGPVWQAVHYLARAGKVKLKRVPREGGGIMFAISKKDKNDKKFWTKKELKNKILEILEKQKELPTIALLRARIDPPPGAGTIHEALKELEQEGKVVLRKQGKNVSVALLEKVPEAVEVPKVEPKKKVDIGNIAINLAKKFLITFEGDYLVALAGSKVKLSDLSLIFENKLDGEISATEKGSIVIKVVVKDV